MIVFTLKRCHTAFSRERNTSNDLCWLLIPISTNNTLTQTLIVLYFLFSILLHFSSYSFFSNIVFKCQFSIFLFYSFSFSINPSCLIFPFFSSYLSHSPPSNIAFSILSSLSPPLCVSLSQRSCPELCSKHHSSSVLLPDRPTVRLFFRYLLSNP